jgi:sugar phosphate isomerase/epimerase
MVRVTAGQAYPETGREQGIDWVLDGFRRSCETAGKCGVMLVYENHSQPGIWDYPDFSYSSDVFLDIAGELAGTGMQILFDTANPMSCGDDPLLMLRRVIDRVACVHAADTRTEGSMDWVLIGTGSVPFIDIFCMLLENGYDGLVSIEEASRCGREGVERSAEYVRQAWQKACGIVESRTGRTSTKEGGE